MTDHASGTNFVKRLPTFYSTNNTVLSVTDYSLEHRTPYLQVTYKLINILCTIWELGLFKLYLYVWFTAPSLVSLFCLGEISILGHINVTITQVNKNNIFLDLFDHKYKINKAVQRTAIPPPKLYTTTGQEWENRKYKLFDR